MVASAKGAFAPFLPVELEKADISVNGRITAWQG
jgi:hypothetical protein